MNPVFLDYRLPFYKELNRLFCGDFHLIFSKERYRILQRNDLYEKIIDEMGDNAHPLTTDYLFDTHSMSFRMKNIEKGRHIPITFGLLGKIRKVNPDVLITEGFFQWTPLVILYGVVFRKPVYIGYERTLHTERNSGKLRRWHRRLTDRFVKGYLVNGSETKRYLESIGIDSNKIHIGGMSADSKGLEAAVRSFDSEKRQELKKSIQSSSGLIFLFVGKLTERKGIANLLSVWSEHRKKFPYDKLLVVGNGNLEEELRRIYGEDASVIFTGGVNYGDIHKFYAISDVFIIPTLEDNWSLVVPEAMACGMPVATSIYNGCHVELIQEGVNGYVFDTLSPDSMLGVLSSFHYADLESMGNKSIEIQKEFDTDHCAQRVYNAIISDIK